MRVLRTRQSTRCCFSLSFVSREAKRTLLTRTVEPPLDKPERPHTLVLVEDQSILNDTSSSSQQSWVDTFAATIPRDHGIPFASLMLTTTDERNNNNDSDNLFHSALAEYTNDLSTLYGPILVTRGPCTSWLAQFYLESSSLAGLVLVDPIPLDATEGRLAYEQATGDRAKDKNHPYSYPSKILTRYSRNPNRRTLLLEPGSVPMLVVSTYAPWKVWSEATAQRHSSSDDRRFESVPVVPLSSSASLDNAQDAKRTICDWVEDVIL